MSTATSIATKFCISCQSIKAASEFASKASVCMECQELVAPSQREVTRRAHTIKRELATLLTELNRGEVDAPNVTQMVVALMEECGGFRGFIRSWVNDIRDARTHRPGCKAVLDADFALAKLIMASDQRRSAVSELAKLSDEEINDLAGNLLMQRIETSASDDQIERLAQARGMKVVRCEVSDVPPKIEETPDAKNTDES